MLLSSLQPRSKRILAVFSLVTAIIAGIAYLQLSWRETVDFDLAGFLWLMRNMPKLAAGFMFWFALAAAAGLWLEAKLTE